MKKIYTILAIITFSFVYCQTDPATVYLKNGSSQKGLINSPNEINSKGKVLFKSNNGSTEEIEISKIEKLDYGSNLFIPIEQDKKNNKYYLICERIIDDPKVKLYVYKSIDTTYYRGLYGTTNKRTSDTYAYFIEMDGKKPEILSGWIDGGIMLFKKKIIKHIIGYFKDKCPGMKNAYENKEIVFKGSPAPFVEYYINNCSKN